MKVFFTETAKNDLAGIAEYISRDNLSAARKWLKLLRMTVEKLREFPYSGRIVPEYGEENIRELIKGNYRIVYKIDHVKRKIIVPTVYHSTASLCRICLNYPAMK